MKNFFSKRKKLLAIIVTPLVICICCFVLSIGFMFLNRIQFFTMDGISMSPTIVTGQTIVGRDLSPNRGDIVIYKSMRNSLVHRVIALPGDKVEYRENTVFVNGIAESNNQYMPDNLDLTTTNWSVLSQEFSVPAGKYLLLGDNRNYSHDSRYIGFVDETDIISVIWIVL